MQCNSSQHKDSGANWDFTKFNIWGDDESPKTLQPPTENLAAQLAQWVLIAEMLVAHTAMWETSTCDTVLPMDAIMLSNKKWAAYFCRVAEKMVLNHHLWQGAGLLGRAEISKLTALKIRVKRLKRGFYTVVWPLRSLSGMKMMYLVL